MMLNLYVCLDGVHLYKQICSASTYISEFDLFPPSLDMSCLSSHEINVLQSVYMLVWPHVHNDDIHTNNALSRTSCQIIRFISLYTVRSVYRYN